MIYDELELRKAIQILKPDNELFEIRAIAAQWNMTGYFTDVDAFITAFKKARPKANANFYFILNEINPDCYSRSQRDRFVENGKPTTSDSDITGYEWLMVDIDPKRPSGTSSSNIQLDAAKATARRVYQYMRSKGWNDPVLALSGNGIHLLYAIGLKNTKENAKLVSDCLKALDMLFSDALVSVDTTTYNPARPCKIYGTMAQKGSNTPEHPHRMSRILKAPDPIRQNDRKLLENLAAILPVPEKPSYKNNYGSERFDLDGFISKHNIRVSRTGDWNGGKKYILDECLFDSGHKAPDAAIFEMDNGALAYHCFHNSCQSYSWRDVRLKFEPGAYDKKFVESKPSPNYQNPEYKAVKVEEKRNLNGKPVFYTTEQIRLMKTPPEEFIKTGISMIDRKMRGLKKGFVTCMSGLRGSGKSSLISQFTLEAAEQGYKVAIFSGELIEKNTYNWLILQGAGRNNVLETQYENFFQVNPLVEETISKWLDEKVYIYNNDYGNNFTELIERLNKCVVEHKVDLIILDNLMSLNVTMLDKDRFQQQSIFVEMLETFAKKANIHIVFVAHPRKSDGFLRLDDVSGSNDIVNRVDNAFILHRVNKDFIRLSQQMFKWKSDNDLYQCDNVMEICKDRNNGVQDVFIPLYFEKSCKRLKNTEYENKVYGWEDFNRLEQDIFKAVDIPDNVVPFLQKQL